MSDNIIKESIESSCSLGSQSDIQNQNINKKRYSKPENSDPKLSKEEMEITWKSNPAPLYRKHNIDLMNFLGSQLPKKNYLNSLNTTKTTDLLGLLNNCIKEIQNIILPENSAKFDFVEDFIEENEKNKKLNEIINSIRNLKERLDELSKSKIKKEFGTNTDNNFIPKKMEEELEEIKKAQKTSLDILVKENLELRKEIKKLRKQIENLVKKENLNKNKNNYQSPPPKENTIENNGNGGGGFFTTLYIDNPNNISTLRYKNNINENRDNNKLPIIHNTISNNFNKKNSGSPKFSSLKKEKTKQYIFQNTSHKFPRNRSIIPHIVKLNFNTKIK